MSNLPNSWTRAEIDQLLLPLANGNTLQQGWSPQCDAVPAKTDAEWGVLKTTAIQQGAFLPEHNKRLPTHLEPRPQIEVKPGDILMTCAGPRNRCGISCLVNSTRMKLLMSGKMYRFNANPKLISSPFLAAFLQTREAQDAIDRMKTGINDSGLNLTQDRFKQLLVPLPPPSEQRRIVAKIEELFSELDKGIESLKITQAQLKVYRQALLKHAFEGKLTAQWRADNHDKLETADALLESIQQKRAERYRKQVSEWESGGRQDSKPRVPKLLTPLSKEEQAELPTLPEEWVPAKLGWMTCSVEYGTSAKSAESGGCPVLRMGNIQNGKFDWSDLVFTNDPIEINQYRLHDGDVLFNRTNSPELVGKTAIFKSNRTAIFAGYLIRVNNIPTIATSEYLNYFLNSHLAKQHGNKVKTDGVNQSNINGEKLINYPFPFCGLEEQKAIVGLLDARVSEIDQLEQTLATSLQQADALRQSILKKAFSGQLVPQDHTAEPAAELLARIKAEQSANPKIKKARK